MRPLLFQLLLLLPLTAWAQGRYTLSGYVRDSATGENLIGAVVYVPGTSLGTLTNHYGFYSLSLEEGTYQLQASYVGYQTFDAGLNINQNLSLNISLRPEMTDSSRTVVITGKREDENVAGTQMGRIELPIDRIKQLPVLFGEVDVLKTIQLMPGVKGAEGGTGFYVRGGSPDQNLILLDEAVVYNTGHLLGFFSVFNADALKNTLLYKGSMPANYGGRLSSVVDITMKDGNRKKLTASGGVGLVSSRLTLEGPLIKDKSSFLLSGRRTYLDIFTRPLLKGKENEGSGYYFYDFNLKVNHAFSDKDRLYLSGYFGRDVLQFRSKNQGFGVEFPWGNATATLRWNHLFSPKLFMNATAIYNEYNSNIEIEQRGFRATLNSHIRDWSSKADWNWYPAAKHEVKFGAQYTWHFFDPSRLTAQAEDVNFDPQTVTEKFAHEAAVYLLDDWKITTKLQANIGLRYSLFSQIGPYKFEELDAQGNVVQTATYEKGEHVKTHHGPEPRVSFRYLINEKQSLKGGYALTRQYVHLVTNSGTTLPTDIWVPSTRLVQPQIGQQWALGYFRNLSRNRYEISAEVYYKDMQNQIEYRDDYIPDISDELEKSFVFGRGRAYGAEFLLQKTEGALTGWVGYTLSRTVRTFPALNGGNPFPAKYDRRHDLSVVSTYKISTRWTLSGLFVFGTGNAYTLPESWLLISGRPYLTYGEINSFRMKPYHRVDISATRHNKTGKKHESSWNFSVYNVYNRRNPFFIYFADKGSLAEGNLSLEARQVSIFPIIPSVTWNFKF